MLRQGKNTRINLSLTHTMFSLYHFVLSPTSLTYTYTHALSLSHTHMLSFSCLSVSLSLLVPSPDEPVVTAAPVSLACVKSIWPYIKTIAMIRKISSCSRSVNPINPNPLCKKNTHKKHLIFFSSVTVPVYLCLPKVLPVVDARHARCVSTCKVPVVFCVLGQPKLFCV